MNFMKKLVGTQSLINWIEDIEYINDRISQLESFLLLNAITEEKVYELIGRKKEYNRLDTKCSK